MVLKIHLDKVKLGIGNCGKPEVPSIYQRLITVLR